MFEFFKNLFKKENRGYKRKKIEYIIACKSMDLEHAKNIIGSDEILTKTGCVSKNGLSIHWPDNYKCHLCKHRIDVEKGLCCELKNCKFDFSCFNIGDEIKIAIQIEGVIFENLKAKIVWQKDANKKIEFYGKMGVSLEEPIDFDF